MLDKLAGLGAFPRILVTGYEEIAEAAEALGVCTVRIISRNWEFLTH